MKYYSRNTLTAGDWLGFIIFLAVVCLIVSWFAAKTLGFSGFEYSTGQRTGIIYKLSDKGLIWKTNEGEMSLQMMKRNSEGQLINQRFAFSVSSPVVAAELTKAAESGEPVTVHYRQYLLRGWRYGGTGYDVTGIVSPE